jgi:seryl-tRNA synthetase
MLDIKWIRDNPHLFNEAMRKRGNGTRAVNLMVLDDGRRSAIAASQDLQQRRNAASKEIGQAMAAKDAARADALKAEVASLKGAAQAADDAEKAADAALKAALEVLPNVPADDAPEGADEAANVEVRRVGNIRNFAFDPKEHFEVGEALGQMDFETAAKLSGARFTLLSGGLARLERALGQFMLDLHTTEHGYTEVNPPLMVRDETLYGTGQLPKFAEDLFRTSEGRWLIPTAEVPLTNIVGGHILDDDYLPRRYTALTPCFRSEAGSAGRDTRGMLRQHQFMKVELVSITTPETSNDEHERMTACAETVLKKLDLPFRTMVLSSGDMGFGAQKTYDIEVWLPGQKAYREISSCSTCGDFQARRMNARYRPAGEKQPRFVHTLNGSGVAVGRAAIAVIENYQNDDGSISIPDVLRSYMGGLTRIEKN